MLKSVYFSNIFSEIYEESRFLQLLQLCVVVFLALFPLFSLHHVTMTVLVSVTKTGTITMTNEQLIQKSFLSFYADAFSFPYESSTSTSPALFSFKKITSSIGSTGASFTTGLL